MIRRLLCHAGLHQRVLRHDPNGLIVSVCRGCEPTLLAILDELAAVRPPFGYRADIIHAAGRP